jgi:MYXO-CTERM domain-containing protein
MKLTVWKRIVMAGVLSVSMAVFPFISPLDAQQPGTPPMTDRRTVDTENDFPWGLLGLLGLLGLAGWRRPTVTPSTVNDPPSRRP